MKIYVIYNEIAREPVSEPFVCKEDAIACFSFNGFLNKTCKADLGIKDTIFSLYAIGTYEPAEFFNLHGSPIGQIHSEVGDNIVLIANGRQDANNVISHAVGEVEE